MSLFSCSSRPSGVEGLRRLCVRRRLCDHRRLFPADAEEEAGEGGGEAQGLHEAEAADGEAPAAGEDHGPEGEGEQQDADPERRPGVEEAVVPPPKPVGRPTKS